MIEKIKQIEKEILKNVLECPYNKVEPDKEHICSDCETENEVLRAKLSVYKECEAEQKRKVEELRKELDIPSLYRFHTLINKRIDKIFNSPQNKSVFSAQDERTLSSVELTHKTEDTSGSLISKKDIPIVILDDNPISLLHYAEEYPENWKKICDEIDKKKKKDY